MTYSRNFITYLKDLKHNSE